MTDKDRVLKEILDSVDVNTEAPGPEGPWEWDSLTIQREMNDIKVFDVDGLLHTVIPVTEDLTESQLRQKLNAAHHESLEDL